MIEHASRSSNFRCLRSHRSLPASLAIMIFLFTSVLTAIRSSAMIFDNEFEWSTRPGPFVKTGKAVVTPKGLMAGEMNTIYGTERYNGVAISDGAAGFFGNESVSWIRKGLENTGITDLYYHDGSGQDSTKRIFASAYYTVDGKKGSYLSSDLGDSWTFLSNNFATSCVNYGDGIIYTGGFSHGLWRSEDLGINWTQLIGSGWYGPRIDEITSFGKTVLTAYDNKVGISYDSGNSWKLIDELYSKTIRYISMNERYILAGSSGNGGLWISSDNGTEWENISFFNDKPVIAIKEYAAGSFISYFDGGYYKLAYYSPMDDAIQETGLLSPFRIVDMGIMFGETNKILAVNEKDVYVSVIPDLSFGGTGLLTFPLASMSAPGYTAYMEKINAFFDHEYPLLGYVHTKEPEQAADTTYNFLGTRDKAPTLYYTSHNGVDFDSYIGEEVLAVDNGTATYYYCKDCGNSIKINHGNGLQSVYMHLRYDDLIVKSGSVSVEKNQKIGSVGMTGRTSGPHLHFQMVKDTDNDGVFSDEFPSGNTDPFGWASIFIQDPWNTYEWSDTLGEHTGTKSEYLWEYSDDTKVYFSTSSSTIPGSITYSNKIITFFPEMASDLTLIVKDYKKPLSDDISTGLMYIPKTSVLINAYDLTRRSVEMLDGSIEILANLSDISESDLQNTFLGSFSFYFYNEVADKWEKMQSTYNNVSGTISTITDHLSQFAVFGTKLDSSAPITQIVITGSVPGSIPDINGWYDNPVRISFYYEDPDTSAEDSTADDGTSDHKDPVATFYMMDSDNDWIQYDRNTDVSIWDTGIHGINYRSVDSTQNYELPKSRIIKVNTDSSGVSRVRVKSSFFSIVP